MSFRSLGANLINNAELAATTSVSQILDGVDNFAIQAVYSDATPGAKSFVAANVTPAADTITITSHGFVTGLKVALSGTNLPGGLSATNYWIIKVDANTIKLASSLVNSAAGTAVDITSAGTTADAALTPASISGNVLKLQMGNDNTNWTDISGDTVTISAAGSVCWNVVTPGYRYVNVLYTPSAGAVNLLVTINGVLMGAR